MTPRPLVGLTVRAVPVALVVTATLFAFQAGVGVTERAGVPEAGWLVQLYYALGLFVLGGLDLGTPSGGPDGARALLWACYFLGPSITTTAVAEGALRMSQPAWWTRLWLREPVVVVGESRVARQYTEAVRSVEPHQAIVTTATLPEHLEDAKRVVIATDDDLTNLDLAWKVRRSHPGLSVLVHVGQLEMRRGAEHLAQEAHVDVFNAYETTADAIYARILAPHLADTPGRDVVAILGFGRFGQTVLRHLRERAADELDRVVVVDRSASTKLRQFLEHAGPGPLPETLDADIRDPATWDALREQLPVLEPPMLVITTDEDASNLQAAIGLRARFRTARIYVRTSVESAFVDQVQAQYTVEALPVGAILREALEAQVEPG